MLSVTAGLNLHELHFHCSETGTIHPYCPGLLGANHLCERPRGCPVNVHPVLPSSLVPCVRTSLGLGGRVAPYALSPRTPGPNPIQHCVAVHCGHPKWMTWGSLFWIANWGPLSVHHHSMMQKAVQVLQRQVSWCQGTPLSSHWGFQVFLSSKEQNQTGMAPHAQAEKGARIKMEGMSGPAPVSGLPQRRTQRLLLPATTPTADILIYKGH